VRTATIRAPHALVLLAGLLLALTACGSSSAATPCWKSVLNDWSNHKLGQTTYPIACYDQAIKNMGPDLRYYSSAPEDIAAAKSKALLKENKDRHTAGLGGSSAGGGSDGGSSGGGNAQSPASQVLGSSSADSVPLPLMILAALAVLLLAAGAVGVANRRLQTRRVAPDETSA
jgi:hypothetical protein